MKNEKPKSVTSTTLSDRDLWLMMQSFKNGYENGNHDTVESQYGDPEEVAEQMIQHGIDEGAYKELPDAIEIDKCTKCGGDGNMTLKNGEYVRCGICKGRGNLLLRDMTLYPPESPDAAMIKQVKVECGQVLEFIATGDHNLVSSVDTDNDRVYLVGERVYMITMKCAIKNYTLYRNADGSRVDEATVKDSLTVEVGPSEINRLELRAEDADCVEHWLDDQKAPKCDTHGGSFSLVGRIKTLMSKFESFDNQRADYKKTAELAMGDAMKEIERLKLQLNKSDKRLELTERAYEYDKKLAADKGAPFHSQIASLNADSSNDQTIDSMRKAANKSIYIWRSNNLLIPKEIAYDAGREDLQIVGPEWLSSNRWRGLRFTDINVDHSANLNSHDRSQLVLAISNIGKVSV